MISGKDRKRIMKTEDMYTRALLVADIAHRGQERKGGKDYLSHPIAVANILETGPASLSRTNVFGGANILQAALMHDVVEDSKITLHDLSDLGFSESVCFIVECLTLVLPKKCDPLSKHDTKTLFLLGKTHFMDRSACMVKLADRLHNLQCVYTLAEEIRIRYAKQSMLLVPALMDRMLTAPQTTDMLDCKAIGISAAMRDMADECFKICEAIGVLE